MTTEVIDCDQHLYESRTMWADHIDPAARDEALRIADDELGYPWLTWRDKRLQIADVQHPGDTGELGRRRERYGNGLASEYRYDEALPDHYWEPSARAEYLAAMGVGQAILFPNYGLLWERELSDSLPALTANMAAWNRWCTSVVAEGTGRLHPVAHLTLRDPVWLEAQLGMLSKADVRLAMIAPALVEGRRLSHPAHDRLWELFVSHGITPVLHVADQPRVFDDAWYSDPQAQFVPVLDSIFLSTPPALAVTDLIINGVLERHPDLHIGIIELGAVWVPLYLMMLDGGWDFTNNLNGRPIVELAQRPSDYFRRQVRVASFSYERPANLIRKAGDLFMCCSDFPHSEGSATPVDDYRAVDVRPEDAAALFYDNARFLLAS